MDVEAPSMDKDNPKVLFHMRPYIIQPTNPYKDRK